MFHSKFRSTTTYILQFSCGFLKKGAILAPADANQVLFFPRSINWIVRNFQPRKMRCIRVTYISPSRPFYILVLDEEGICTHAN